MLVNIGACFSTNAVLLEGYNKDKARSEWEATRHVKTEESHIKCVEGLWVREETRHNIGARGKENGKKKSYSLFMCCIT